MMLLTLLLDGTGAVFWTACALLYGLRSPWWRSRIGWSLIGSWSALSAVLLLSVALLFLRLPPAVELGLAVTVVVAVDLAGLMQLVTVILIQRRRSRDDHPQRRATDYR